jgi:hypothetical protein
MSTSEKVTKHLSTFDTGLNLPVVNRTQQFVTLYILSSHCQCLTRGPVKWNSTPARISITPEDQ